LHVSPSHPKSQFTTHYYFDFVILPYSALKCHHISFDLYTFATTPQNDTMSYLILPSLVEAGFFHAARLQHKQICAFHSGAKRDTLDMVSRCYKYANYAKANELHRFVDLCQSSIQLALTRAELPLLEIVELRDSADDARRYLDDYFNGLLLESQGYLEADELTKLRDNIDYSLLVSTETCERQERLQRAVRRAQLCQRIRVAQAAVRILYHALRALTVTGDHDAAEAGASALESIRELRELTARFTSTLRELADEGLGEVSTSTGTGKGASASMSMSMSCSQQSRDDQGLYSFGWLSGKEDDGNTSTPIADTNDATATATVIATIAVPVVEGESGGGFLPWNQRLLVQFQGSLTTSDSDTSSGCDFDVEGLTWRTVCDIASVALSVTDSGCEGEGICDASGTGGALSRAMSGIDSVRKLLLGGCIAQDFAASERALLNPTWLRAASLFTRTLAALGPLLLLAAEERLEHGARNEKKSDISSIGDALAALMSKSCSPIFTGKYRYSIPTRALITNLFIHLLSLVLIFNRGRQVCVRVSCDRRKLCP
jgi:N-acetyltransferase B complex (NatB) non catalytic subunit